jgi:hypothetical protein
MGDRERFEKFHAAHSAHLAAIDIPFMPDASWDRKAAYVLWTATDGGNGLDWYVEDEHARAAVEGKPVVDDFADLI